MGSHLSVGSILTPVWHNARANFGNGSILIRRTGIPASLVLLANSVSSVVPESSQHATPGAHITVLPVGGTRSLGPLSRDP